MAPATSSACETAEPAFAEVLALDDGGGAWAMETISVSAGTISQRQVQAGALARARGWGKVLGGEVRGTKNHL
jgi:hypothetical protein